MAIHYEVVEGQSLVIHGPETSSSRPAMCLSWAFRRASCTGRIRGRRREKPMTSRTKKRSKTVIRKPPAKSAVEIAEGTGENSPERRGRSRCRRSMKMSRIASAGGRGKKAGKSRRKGFRFTAKHRARLAGPWQDHDGQPAAAERGDAADRADRRPDVDAGGRPAAEPAVTAWRRLHRRSEHTPTGEKLDPSHPDYREDYEGHVPDHRSAEEKKDDPRE